ncbi:MAG: hypothetical protein ACI9DF_004571 [Verrucomicrobiales bacterium]
MNEKRQEVVVLDAAHTFHGSGWWPQGWNLHFRWHPQFPGETSVTDEWLADAELVVIENECIGEHRERIQLEVETP